MLLPRYWAASQQLLHSCSLYQLSVLWWARAKLGCMPNSAWSSAFWQAATRALAAGLAAVAAAAAPYAGSLSVTLSQNTPQLAFSAAKQANMLVPAGASAARRDTLSPATVVRLIWATGKMARHVPAVPAGLMLQAAQQIMPQCSFGGLTAMGLGLARMQRAAAAAPAAAGGLQGQQLQQQPGRGVATGGQQAALWESWFARSLQLLLQDPKVAARMRSQHQQQGHTDRRSGASTTAASHPQQVTAAQQQQQQQQQQRVSIRTADISLQLFIVAHLRLEPPAAWSQAMLAAAAAHLQGMNLEQLSWVVWAVAQLRLGPQLPHGWLHAMLVKACSGPGRSRGCGSGAAGAMLRLGKSLRQLRSAKCVQQQEWQLWLLLAKRLNTTQGVVSSVLWVV
jgi:hypothetical protein